MNFEIILLASILCINQLNAELLIFNGNDNNGKVVATSYGKLRGFGVQILGENHAFKKAQIFLGIPFARPPVAELRFEKPIDPERWPDDLIKNASEFGPACHPVIPLSMSIEGALVKFSEDCLHLNVMAPDWESPSQNALYPVVVWFHGGGFKFGSAIEFGYKFITEQYVSKGVVFVTFQYRLGQLGFASTGHANFAGNYGLWDQTAALKYLKKNIRAFGVNPEKIILLGHSSGGASISHLSLSPHSRDLFSQSIQISGAVFAEWAASNRVIFETKKIATRLQCDMLEGSNTIKECLKSKTIHEIYTAFRKESPPRREINIIEFTPRLDADFFTDDLPTLFEEAPKKPTISGFGDAAGLTFTLLPIKAFPSPNFIPKEKYLEFGQSEFEAYIREAVAPEKLFGKEQTKKVQQELIDFYLNSDEDDDNDNHIFSLAKSLWQYLFSKKGKVNSDHKFYLAKYVELFSDVMFVIPMLIESSFKMENKWPTFMYQIDYISDKAPEALKKLPVQGAYHCIEYPFLFNRSYFGEGIIAPTRDDLAFREVLINATVNFAKTGDPSTPTFKWSPSNLAQLNANPKMMDNRKIRKILKKFAFWQRIRENYDFDLIRGFNKQTLKSKDEL